MKGKYRLLVFSVGIIFSILLGKNVYASPDYNNQTIDDYFKLLVIDAEKNGYESHFTKDQMRDNSHPIKKLEREIIGAKKKDPQFYLQYTREDSVSIGSDFSGVAWPHETMSLSGKLKFVDEKVAGQSQYLLPIIYTRYKDNDHMGDGLRTNFPESVFYNINSQRKGEYDTSQGFMYAESNEDGTNFKIKQFDYIKNTTWFKVLWNPKTESMIWIMREKSGRDTSGDKLFKMTTTIDETMKLINVEGELFYFGDDAKHFTLLNQMSYGLVTRSSRPPYTSPGIYTYGHYRGLSMNNPEDNSTLTIRTDRPNGPKSWAAVDYPFVFGIKRYDNRTGSKAASPQNFMDGFNSSETIRATGIESQEVGSSSGNKITDTYTYYLHIDGDTTTVNSIKLKSDTKTLQKGSSMSLAYGFQPSTLYNLPVILPIADQTKLTTEDLSVDVNWVDQHVKTEGGTIKYYVGDDTTPVGEYHYKKGVEIDGEFKLNIDAKHFKPGVENKVKLVITDDLYGTPGIDNNEHISNRTFKVFNKRLIPIKYETQLGNKLDVPESVEKQTKLLDGESVELLIPRRLGEGEKYPLKKVKPENDPNVNLQEKTGKLNIKGKESLETGVTVIYEINERELNVEYVDMNNKPILGVDSKKIIGGENMPYNFEENLSTGEPNPDTLIIPIEGYEFIESQGAPLKGRFPTDNIPINIKLYYKRLNPTVTTYYLQLDKAGNPTETKVFEKIDDRIRKEPRIITDASAGEVISEVTEPLKFEGYENILNKSKFETTDGKTVTDGKVPENDLIVTYYYQPIESISVPENLSFGQNHESKMNVTYGVEENNVSNIDVLNTYENSQWELLASSEGLKSEIDGSTLFADIFYKKGTDIKMISNDTKPITSKKSELKANFPMSSENKQDGLFVKVREDVKKGQYTGKIKFSLLSAP